MRPTARFIAQPHRPLSASAHLLRTLASVAPGARVIDLLAGTGRHLVPLAQLGFDVWGATADVEAARVALAEVVGEAEAARRVAASSPIATGQPEASADWVVLAGAGRQRAAALAEAFRVVVPGGWVWVETERRDGIVDDARAAGLVESEAPAEEDGRVHAIFRRPGGVG